MVAPDHITTAQNRILEYIALHQPVTVSEISDCQHMSLPNTSREIKKLTEKNLIQKNDAFNDRRKQLIRLTPEGEAVMKESFHKVKEHFLKRMPDVTEEDLKLIEDAVKILQKKVFYN